MRELKSDGWKDLNLTTKEKDVIVLLNCGEPPLSAARKLGVSVDFVNILIAKLKKSFDSDYLNMSRMDRRVKREMKFRKIIAQAMSEEGVIDLDDKCSFLQWAIGEDYAYLPPQDWPYRIMQNVKLIGIDRMAPVKAVIRAACEIWKGKRIIIGA